MFKIKELTFLPSFFCFGQNFRQGLKKGKASLDPSAHRMLTLLRAPVRQICDEEIKHLGSSVYSDSQKTVDLRIKLPTGFGGTIPAWTIGFQVWSSGVCVLETQHHHLIFCGLGCGVGSGQWNCCVKELTQRSAEEWRAEVGAGWSLRINFSNGLHSRLCGRQKVGTTPSHAQASVRKIDQMSRLKLEQVSELSPG